jgi:hypothetical protein
MSGDGINNVKIPSVFLFGKEGNDLIWNMRSHSDLIVFMGDVSNKKGMSGPEYALTYNTDQLRLALDLDRQKSCAKFTFSSSPKPTQCYSNEFAELKPFYDLYYRRKNNNNNDDSLHHIGNSDDDDGDEIQIISIDEAIAIKVKSNGRREMIVDLESLENEAKQIPSQEIDDAHSRSVKVFDLLLNRFVKRTNFMNLKNFEQYSKTLFNFVYSSLNPVQGGFSKEDREFFYEMAQILDAKRGD